MHLPTSYPVPYRRTNNDHATRKLNAGYMNDSSYTNPADPSSMMDHGKYQNGYYNLHIKDLPKGTKFVASKKPRDWQTE